MPISNSIRTPREHERPPVAGWASKAYMARG
jgi:hypothetical protein